MSPRRAAAQQAVEDAIGALRAVVAVEDPDVHEDNEILTAWVIVASRLSLDAEGSSTAISVYMPDTMPDWQTVGLLRAGGVMVEDDFRGASSST